MRKNIDSLRNYKDSNSTQPLLIPSTCHPNTFSHPIPIHHPSHPSPHPIPHIPVHPIPTSPSSLMSSLPPHLPSLLHLITHHSSNPLPAINVALIQRRRHHFTQALRQQLQELRVVHYCGVDHLTPQADQCHALTLDLDGKEGQFGSTWVTMQYFLSLVYNGSHCFLNESLV